MRALRFAGNGNLEIVDAPKPRPKGDEVLIRVRACAICSTDVRYRFLVPEPLPVIPGHEISGEVVEVDRPHYVKLGERVSLTVHAPCGYCSPCRRGDGAFCEQLSKYGSLRDGGNAEYVLAKETSCLPLPDEYSFDDGALIGDTLGTAYHAVKKLGILPGQKVLVVGGGPIGLTAARIALWLGATLYVAELSPYRIALAKRLKLENCINSKTEDIGEMISKATGGRGFDHVIECGGNAVTFQMAIDAAAVGGNVMLVSMVKSVEIKPAADICPKELTIMSSWNFNIHEYREMIHFYDQNRDLCQLITHHYPLEKATEAYALFISGESGKIVFQPNG